VKEGHYRPQESKPFDAWADEWLASLERKATTRAGYSATRGWRRRCSDGRALRSLEVTCKEHDDQNGEGRCEGAASVSGCIRHSSRRALWPDGGTRDSWNEALAYSGGHERLPARSPVGTTAFSLLAGWIGATSENKP
jgi:hypothetical protein